MKFIYSHKRLEHLKKLLADEIQSDQPGSLYIEDLKLSISRELGGIIDKDNRVDDYEIIEASIPFS